MSAPDNSTRYLANHLNTLWSQRRYDAYVQAVLAALKGGQNLPFEAVVRAYQCARQAGQIDHAEALVAFLLKALPDNSNVQALAADLAQHRGQWHRALDHLQRLRALGHETPQNRLVEASIHERLFEPARALKIIEATDLGEDPALLWQARFVQANAWMQQKAYDRVLSLEACLEQPHEDSQQTAAVWKTVGKALDRQGDYARAFDYFRRGNEMVARLSPMDPERNPARRQVAVARATVSREWARGFSPTPAPRREPVFMVGFPRSGTTLLEQILDAHPGIQALEEPPTVRRALQQADAWARQQAADRGLLDPDADWLAQGREAMTLLADMPADQVEAMRETYFRQLSYHLEWRPGQICIDKMPLNSARLPYILRMFPNAKIIVSLRHPCDCLLSCFMQPFSLNANMKNFLSLDHAASFYEQVMALLWQSIDAFGIAEQVHWVRYEDLIADFEGEAERILDFLGLEHDPAIARYRDHARQRGSLKTPSYQAVKEPISRDAQGRWRHYADHLVPLFGYLESACERYGYELSR